MTLTWRGATWVSQAPALDGLDADAEEPKQPKKRKESGWARERRLKKEQAELVSAVRETFVSKVAQEMKEELKEELKAELRPELREQMKQALKVELLAEIQASLTSTIAAEKNR